MHFTSIVPWCRKVKGRSFVDYRITPTLLKALVLKLSRFCWIQGCHLSPSTMGCQSKWTVLFDKFCCKIKLSHCSHKVISIACVKHYFPQLDSLCCDTVSYMGEAACNIQPRGKWFQIWSVWQRSWSYSRWVTYSGVELFNLFTLQCCIGTTNWRVKNDWSVKI